MTSKHSARTTGAGRTVALGLSLLPAMAGAQPTEPPAQGSLTVHFAGLRSAKGMIRVCLTHSQAYFLDCEKDEAAFKASVAAGPQARVDFADVPPGDYALMAMHDENGNGKLDTMMGIPREGIAFSRDPAMHFGPPKWADARFHVGAGANEMTVRFKYFL